MKISRESRRTARELFRLSMVNGRVNAARTEEISSTLAAERPRGYFGILKELSRLIRLELSKHHARIESAAALDSSTSTEIAKNLQTRFGDDITTEFLVNPALLGGIRIKIGSDVWDGSISSRLATFSRNI